MSYIWEREREREREKINEFIGFTLVYFKMAAIPLVPETKMVDVGKLISLENLLVRKVTWFVLTTTSTSLIFNLHIWSRPHDKDFLYIISSSKNSLSHILTYRDSTHTFSLSLSLTHTFWFPETVLSLSSFRLPETARPCQLVRHNSIRVTWVYILRPFSFQFFLFS